MDGGEDAGIINAGHRQFPVLFQLPQSLSPFNTVSLFS